MENTAVRIVEPPARRTRVRWMIIAILFLIACINYADRATLSIAGPALTRETGIDASTLGWLLSAFAWTYALGQIPGGLLLDRFGTRITYITSIALWSAFTLAQGLVGGLHVAGMIATIFVLRLMVGLAEAPAFPANARLVSGWFPQAERGTASAIFNSAQYFSVVMFTPLMGWLTHSFGWPMVFLVMGAIGIGVAALFAWQVRSPVDHRAVSQGELEYMRAGGALVDLERAGMAATGKRERLFTWARMRPLITSRMLIGVYIGQYCINVLTYFFITWFPVYLVKQRGLSIVDAGLLASAPALCGFLGGLVGGIVSDRILKATGSPTVARKGPLLIGMLLAMAILGCNYVDSIGAVILLMSMAFFGKGVASLGWAVVADVSPPRLIGLTGSIFNTCGNLAGIVTPIAVGYLVDASGSFESALVFVAAHCLLTIIAYFAIVPKIRRIELD